MIDRDARDKIRLVCDNECGEHTDWFDNEEFRDMIREAKEDGWLVETDETGNWMHWCGDCR